MQSWAVAHCADAIHSGVTAIATFMPKFAGANQSCVDLSPLKLKIKIKNKKNIRVADMTYPPTRYGGTVAVIITALCLKSMCVFLR